MVVVFISTFFPAQSAKNEALAQALSMKEIPGNLPGIFFVPRLGDMRFAGDLRTV